MRPKSEIYICFVKKLRNPEQLDLLSLEMQTYRQKPHKSNTFQVHVLFKSNQVKTVINRSKKIRYLNDQAS